MKSRRLSRAAEFDAVYRRGRSASTRHLVVYSFPRPEEASAPLRLGMSVSRKVGSAVERNHIKRLMREAFELLRPKLATGADIVVVARPGLNEKIEREGLDWLTSELNLLIRKGLEVA